MLGRFFEQKLVEQGRFGGGRLIFQDAFGVSCFPLDTKFSGTRSREGDDPGGTHQKEQWQVVISWNVPNDSRLFLSTQGQR